MSVTSESVYAADQMICRMSFNTKHVFFFQIGVYETNVKNGQRVFLSLSGESGDLRSGDTVTLNGLYAEKLGIKDNQEVRKALI